MGRAGTTRDAVLRIAGLTRRAVTASVLTAFVLTLALSSFDRQHGVPSVASTCLSDCPPVSPAAARLVAEQEALGRSCATRAADDGVAVLQEGDGAVRLATVPDALAMIGSPDVVVLAYCD